MKQASLAHHVTLTYFLSGSEFAHSFFLGHAKLLHLTA